MRTVTVQAGYNARVPVVRRQAIKNSKLVAFQGSDWSKFLLQRFMHAVAVEETMPLCDAGEVRWRLLKVEETHV